MRTRITGLLAVVALLAGAGAALAADGEPARKKAAEPADKPAAVSIAEPISAEAVPLDAGAEPAEETATDTWTAERSEIERLRADASNRIAEIKYRLEDEDLAGEEKTALQRQVGDIKIETEIRVQEIRLSVAERRGMTRQAEEIRKALESLRNLDAPAEKGVVDRPESAPAPGNIVRPDQG